MKELSAFITQLDVVYCIAIFPINVLVAQPSLELPFYCVLKVYLRVV